MPASTEGPRQIVSHGVLDRATNVPSGKTGSGSGARAATETGAGEGAEIVGLEAGGVAEARLQATPARVPTTMSATRRREVILGIIGL